MKITSDWLESKGACKDGISWFEEHFWGEVECQDVLNKLAEINKTYWAQWLVKKAGKSEKVMVCEDLSSDKSIFFLGSIRAEGSISCFNLVAGGDVRAGGDVDAGGDVMAGGHVDAGGYVDAGGDLKAFFKS